MYLDTTIEVKDGYVYSIVDPEVKIGDITIVDNIGLTALGKIGNRSIRYSIVNREIRVFDLPWGNYYVKEISNNSYGYGGTELKEARFIVHDYHGYQAIVTMTNRKNVGNLKIIKTDRDSNMKMQGVGFKIKNSAGQYIKVIDSGGKAMATVDGEVVIGNVQYTTKAQATEFITGTGGEIIICGILAGTYTVEETSLGRWADLYDMKIDSNPVTVVRQETTNTTSPSVAKSYASAVTITNKRARGNLKILKVRKGKNSIKIAGVGFKIRDNLTGKYVNRSSNGTITYVAESQATVFETNASGEITVNNIYAGQHTLYEAYNKNDRYELITGGIGVMVKKNVTTSKTIENKYQWIDLSGYVFEDKIYTEGKVSKTNSYYRDNGNDINDILVQDIPVRLKDSKGNIVTNKKGQKCETTTQLITNPNTGKSQIQYMFTYIDSYSLNNYYIEFEYNGMKYESVNINYSTNQNDLNNLYTNKKTNASKAGDVQTGTGKTRSTLNNNYGTITKNSNVQYSQSTYTNKVVYQKTAHGTEHGPQTNYSVLANTNEGKYKLTKDYSEGDEYIDNINLGISEREQPDLSVKKDIDMVRVSINGKTHIYKYADRINNAVEVGDGLDMAPTLKFQGKYSDMSYTRALYASDVMYDNSADRSKELKVEVIYKIDIKNQATTLRAKVNEIADYYDSKYQNIAIGKEIKQYKVENNASIVRRSIGDKTIPAGYQGIYINPNLEIDAGKSASLYVMLEVKKESAQEIVKQDKPIKLDNISEITSYTTMKNGALRAGIDVDSKPGSTIPGNRETYEDDTDRAPGFTLKLQNQRETEGNAFEDTTILQGNERKGNGKYEDGEKAISGITVELVDSQGKTVDTYDENAKKWITGGAKTTTDANGYYYIGGYIPGDYKVKFTWGKEEGKYTVQDYKSTNYEKQRREGSGPVYNPEQDVQWYKKNTERYSDAIDNYETRKAIDAQSSLMTYERKTLINEANSSDTPVKMGTEDIITKMDSYTPVMDIEIEYIDGVTDGTDEYAVDDPNNVYVEKKEGQKHSIKRLDFGITKRPMQDISLEKRIKRVSIKLANGATLIDAEVVKDETTGQYRLKDEVDYTTYLPKSGSTNGRLKIEVDKEITQGATLSVEYEFVLTNISEIDYTTENYYKYGEKGSYNDLVKMTPNKLIEYLDNQTTVATEPDKWKVQEDVDKLTEDKILDPNLKEYLSGTERIYIIELAKENLAPGESSKQTIKFNTSKVLSNGEDITIGNHSEVIELTRTGGSLLVSTPGNYNPTNAETYENDSGIAEEVIVVPPTGENREYVIYTLIGIVTLVIISTGIVVIIKKKSTK